MPGGVIGAFKMLKTLKIDENRLALLPPEIGNLVKLETLIVAGNLLTYLPETLARDGVNVLIRISQLLVQGDTSGCHEHPVDIKTELLL